MRDRGESSRKKLPLPHELDTDPFVLAFEAALTRRQAEGKATWIPQNESWAAARRMIYDYGQQLREHYDLDIDKFYRPCWLDQLPPPGLARHLAIEGDRVGYLWNAWQEQLKEIPQGDCLDVGCGSGFFLRYMQHRDDSRQWYGIDLPNPSLPGNGYEQLDRRTIPEFQEYDGRDFPADWTGRFSGLTLHNVMHHIPPEQLQHFFDELHRITKAGAHIILTEEMGHGLNRKPGLNDGIIAHEDHPIDLGLKLLDDCFYPNGKGWQRAPIEWQVLFDQNGFTQIFAGDNGVYNAAGIPIAEGYIAFERRADDERFTQSYKFTARNPRIYGLPVEGDPD